MAQIAYYSSIWPLDLFQISLNIYHLTGNLQECYLDFQPAEGLEPQNEPHNTLYLTAHVMQKII